MQRLHFIANQYPSIFTGVLLHALLVKMEKVVGTGPFFKKTNKPTNIGIWAS